MYALCPALNHKLKAGRMLNLAIRSIMVTIKMFTSYAIVKWIDMPGLREYMVDDSDNSTDNSTDNNVNRDETSTINAHLEPQNTRHF